MKIELVSTCLPVEMLIRLRENGLCIKLNKTDDAFVKWGKEMENYCFEHGDFPTYTAVFDTYPVFIGDDTPGLTYQYKGEYDQGTPLYKKLDASIQGNISNIMAPILDTLQGYIDKCENGELTDAVCLHQLDALWLERLTLDTDDWTITPTFGS